MLNHAALSRARFAHRSYTVTCGQPKRVGSLVDDAKFDSQRNRELIEEHRSWLLASSNRLQRSNEKWLTDGESFTSGEHLEARDEEETQTQRSATERELPYLDGLSIEEHLSQLVVDYPRHISQLDQCNHLLIKYEPELDPTHPGFHDLEYRARRRAVAQLAFEYRHGQPIPEVEYEERELATWRYIYTRLKAAYAKYACSQHNQAIRELEQHAGYSADSIPQLARVSSYLERRTGWRLRPAAGLLSARDFLASLAFRVFQTTQYIRHWGNPEHSVEPDCIHELMGHIPMLCDPTFAHFSQELGLASLGASDEQIEKFATLYWFTIEFGLCREPPPAASSTTSQPNNKSASKTTNSSLKCYGAGLLSSYGEMEHALESGKPQLKEFEAEKTAMEEYQDAEYQVTYYVVDSLEETRAKLRDYATKHLARDHELAYEPYSCSIIKLDSLNHLNLYADQIKSQLTTLCSALAKAGAQQQLRPQLASAN